MLGLGRGGGWHAALEGHIRKTSLKKHPEMRRATGRGPLEEGMTRAKALFDGYIVSIESS